VTRPFVLSGVRFLGRGLEGGITLFQVFERLSFKKFLINSGVCRHPTCVSKRSNQWILPAGLLLMMPLGCVPDLAKNSLSPGPIQGDFAVSDYFSASGFMGDGEERGFLTVTRDEDCKERPDGAQGSCFHFTYNVGAVGWSGVYFQYPANNWGTEQGRAIGDTYSALRFDAAAEYRIILPAGGGLDDSCSDADPCRNGLACVSGACEAAANRAAGQGCLISAECEEGLQCSGLACTEPGQVENGMRTVSAEGEACARGDDGICAAGLRCNDSFVCGENGSGDVGDSCTTRDDCHAGLLCDRESKCYPRTEMGPMRFRVGGINESGLYEHEDTLGPDYLQLPGMPQPVLTADMQTFEMDLSREDAFSHLIGGFMWGGAFPNFDEARKCEDSERDSEGRCPPQPYFGDESQPVHFYFDNMVFLSDSSGQSGGAQ
jgi:hypothetical protein